MSFLLGLGPGVLINDDYDDDDDESQDSNEDDTDVQDDNYAKEYDEEVVLALSDAIEHDDRVMSVFCKLDFHQMS
jgi:hypothetical protein